MSVPSPLPLCGGRLQKSGARDGRGGPGSSGVLSSGVISGRGEFSGLLFVDRFGEDLDTKAEERLKGEFVKACVDLE